MGHWLLQPLSGCRSVSWDGEAVAVCLPGVSWDGAGKVETEKKRKETDGVVVTWCRSVAAFHLKAFFRGVGGLDVSLGSRVCMCFLLRGQHRSCICTFVCGWGWVCTVYLLRLGDIHRLSVIRTT